MDTYQALPGSSRTLCVKMRLSIPGYIVLAGTILFSMGFGFTLYLCQHAEPQIDFFCPSNGICNSTSVVDVLKYQRCADSKNSPIITWCDKLNCSESSCAQYLFNCGLETSQGLTCVSLLSKSNGWCSSRNGSLVLFVFFSIFFPLHLIAFFIICFVENRN